MRNVQGVLLVQKYINVHPESVVFFSLTNAQLECKTNYLIITRIEPLCVDLMSAAKYSSPRLVCGRGCCYSRL